MGYYTHFKLKFNEETDFGKEVVRFFEGDTIKNLSVTEFRTRIKDSMENFLNNLDKLETKARELNIDRDFVSLLHAIWLYNAEETKWYTWEDDMKNFSKLFPEVLFQLSGEGEDNGDMWKAYFQNGLCQVIEAIITFESYDPKKMK
jgi:hypothetical protein